MMIINPYNVLPLLGLEHVFVSENRARIANKNLTFSGTVRTVGTSGATYTTLSAAYSAASNGDILSLTTDINTSNEPGGYCLINNAAKGVKILGNGFKITQTSANSFSLRLRSCQPCMIENVYFDHTLVNPAVYIDGDEANRIFVFKNCTFRNTNNSQVNGYFVNITNLALTDAVEKHFEFDGCDFLKSFSTPNTNANLIKSGPASTTTTYLFTNCTSDITNANSLRFVADTKPTIAVYDCDFIQRSSDPILYFASDTAAPVVTGMNIDLRGNTLTYATGFGQHGILFGRGTDLIYACNNQLHTDPSSNALVIGFVIKTVASVYGNAEFAGNYINSPRPMLIKGASKLNIHHNSVVANYSTNYALTIDNDVQEVELLCRNNSFTYNNFVGMGGMVNLAPTSASETVKTSMVNTCTLNYNKYYTPNDVYVSDADNSATIAWAQKSSYWTLDANSYLIHASQLPITLP